ncbi:MAG TPA: LysE family transporter [Rhizomicrobium sp.]|jgi:threonine/homoserine/homoserine lactone efflux protein|nr:LysE family transporter [Rhizomicrobium sp.]
MTPIVALFSILAAQALGAISPGPSFLFVVRTSVAISRKDGLAAALGMGLGAAIVTTLALVGVRAVISQVEWLYIAFKLLGGAYLVYLAFRLWQGSMTKSSHAEDGAPPAPRRGLGRSFLMALATQLSNPKTVVVISGIYAALLPAHVPLWMYLAIPPIDFMMEGGWYAFVAVAMSSSRPRAVYLNAQSWIDRAAGTLLGVLGLRLIYESTQKAV